MAFLCVVCNPNLITNQFAYVSFRDGLNRPIFLFLNASAQSSFNMCSSTSTTATTGFFYDSGGPSFSHGNNENVLFPDLSLPGCVTGLTMTFTQMSLESCCDRLRIYDGTSAAGTLIGTYTGSTLPPVINSTTGSIFLNFHF